MPPSLDHWILGGREQGARQRHERSGLADGPGWRALDIQGWSAFDPSCRPLGEAFVAGYRAVRPLGGANREAAPFLTLAQDVWSLSLELRYRIDRTDAAAVETFLATGIADLVADLDHIG